MLPSMPEDNIERKNAILHTLAKKDFSLTGSTRDIEDRNFFRLSNGIIETD